MTSKLVMVGAFPPPTYGLAAVNESVLQKTRAAGASPRVINLAARTLDRSLIARLGRLPRVLGGLLTLAFARRLRGAVLYMSVSGGWGQLYELAFLSVARFRGLRRFLHHHSFAYLDRQSAITRALVWMAGVSAVHVVLSPGMANRLKTSYKVRNVVAVSNAVFLELGYRAKVQPRRRLSTALFLSNISQEKGVFEFLDLMAAAAAAGLQIQGVLAGPFQDAEVEGKVIARLADLSNVEYVGAKYGAEKEALLAAADVLIFPTLYSNEAEPIIIHEAMAYGMVIIAYARGAIGEILGPSAGVVIDSSAPFVPRALRQLTDWLTTPESLEAASEAAGWRFRQIMEENDLRWRNLLRELVSSEFSVGCESSQTGL